MIDDKDCIYIEDWMLNKLNLKGNELIVYAVINSHIRFQEPIQYIADWTGTSKRAVFNILKRLLDKGLIKKEERYDHGIKLIDYYTVDLEELNK